MTSDELTIIGSAYVGLAGGTYIYDPANSRMAGLDSFAIGRL